MRGIHQTLAAAAAAFAIAACAPATEQAGGGIYESHTTLHVDNDNWSEMTIYVMRGVARAVQPPDFPR